MAKADWEDWWDIFVRDHCTCVYCGYAGTNLLMWRQLCIDHVIPTSAGGLDDPRNKVVACTYCNNMKRDFDPSDGQMKYPATDEAREALVERAKRHIPVAIAESYGNKPGEEQRDFELMMSEIGVVTAGK